MFYDLWVLISCNLFAVPDNTAETPNFRVGAKPQEPDHVPVSVGPGCTLHSFTYRVKGTDSEGDKRGKIDLIIRKQWTSEFLYLIDSLLYGVGKGIQKRTKMGRRGGSGGIYAVNTTQNATPDWFRDWSRIGEHAEGQKAEGGSPRPPSPRNFVRSTYPPPPSNPTPTLPLPRVINVEFSLAASPEISYTWLSIAYSDERWLYYQFSLPHIYISLSTFGTMYFLNLGVKGLTPSRSFEHPGARHWYRGMAPFSGQNTFQFSGEAQVGPQNTRAYELTRDEAHEAELILWTRVFSEAAPNGSPTFTFAEMCSAESKDNGPVSQPVGPPEVPLEMKGSDLNDVFDGGSLSIEGGQLATTTGTWPNPEAHDFEGSTDGSAISTRTPSGTIALPDDWLDEPDTSAEEWQGQ